MNGVVIDVPGATIEFECYHDEIERAIVNIRIHNAEGQHVLLRLPSPRLMIFDGDREVDLPIQSGVQVYEEGRRVA